MTLEIVQFPCLSDNYGVLIHDAASGRTASIDAPEADAVRAALAARGWRLTDIFTTHHHADHTDGNLALKAETGCTIIGPAAEADRIPGIDRTVSGGDSFDFAGAPVRVIATPGHTLGHIAYHFPTASAAFVGDTLFSLGCGRMFEGTAEGMWGALEALAALPGDTAIYCGHEYTQSNARFALHVDAGNAALKRRAEEVERLRAAGKPTLPTTVALEKATNPFLRADAAELRAAMNLPDAPAAEVFGALRRAKDTFR